MTLAAGLNWISNFCVGLFFPSVQHALGTWSFVPFCAVLVVVFVLTVLYVPETRGKTLQQIHASLGFASSHDGDVPRDADDDPYRDDTLDDDETFDRYVQRALTSLLLASSRSCLGCCFGVCAHSLSYSAVNGSDEE